VIAIDATKTLEYVVSHEITNPSAMGAGEML